MILIKINDLTRLRCVCVCVYAIMLCVKGIGIIPS